MISVLTPILKVAKLQVHLDMDDKGEKLIVTLCPKMRSDKLDEDSTDILNRPVTKSYVIEGFDDEKFFNDLLDYQNTIMSADEDLNALADEIKKHVADKKAKAKPKPKPKTHAKSKPKKKTQAELREEARAKQAKEKESEPEQGELFSGNRLSSEEEAEDIATKAEEKQPLKTAVEKAEEKTEDDPLAGL